MGQLQEQDIPIIILLGTAGMLILVGGIAFFILIYQQRILREEQMRGKMELDHQNQMFHLQIESQEIERKRIGADLHDSLGSLLWGAKVNASFIQKYSPMNDDAQQSYEELNQILDESIEVVRRIAWELTPEVFQYSGLSESVSKLCERLHGKFTEIRLREVGSFFWNDNRALNVFRIVQELISNVVKHSEASSLIVIMIWKEKSLKIRVKDNGIGFTLDQKPKGVGLWSISQRIKQLNGKIRIGIPPIGRGADAVLEIPLNHE